MNANLLLRIAMAIILLTHSVSGMFNNGINDFGNLFLNQIGFAPYGVFLAWSIKLSHVVAAILLLANKYIKLAGFVTIFVLIMGIVLVHFKEGWFVVQRSNHIALFAKRGVCKFQLQYVWICCSKNR